MHVKTRCLRTTRYQQSYIWCVFSKKMLNKNMSCQLLADSTTLEYTDYETSFKFLKQWYEHGWKSKWRAFDHTHWCIMILINVFSSFIGFHNFEFDHIWLLYESYWIFTKNARICFIAIFIKSMYSLSNFISDILS